MPRQLSDDARVELVCALDHLGHVAARDALGHDHDQLDPVLERLEDGVLVNAGGTVTTEPSGTAPACSTTCATVSKTSTPWTSRPFRPGVTPPTIFDP